MHAKRRQLSVEPLETRYAPATLVNPFTVTYRMFPDGDDAVVRISKPLFQQATINDVFDFHIGDVSGDNDDLQVLLGIDLSILDAAGATLTVTNLDEKDGAVVGIINASHRDLAAVVVHGSLGSIQAGDDDLSTPGLGLLQCENLVSTTNPSQIQGDLTRVKIKEAMDGFLDVNGSVGSFKADRVTGDSNLGSGRLRCATNLGSLRVRFLLGTEGGETSGVIDVGGDIGKLIVADNMRGKAANSGQILCAGDIGLLSIGNLSAESGSGANAGRVAAQGSIGRILIGNSLQGSDAANTGSIFAGRDIGSVKIDGGIFGHLGAESGSIVTGAGRIGSVQVDLIVGGLGLRSASIRSAEDIGSIKVNKNVGGNAAAPILFTARGQDTPGQTTDLAIGKISIGGDVTHANIIAGVDTLGVPLNADAQIGSIKVGGDWTASSIAAGIDDGADNLFGTDDDTLIDEAPNDDPNIVARVGKISIGGAADGSSDGGDAFGFVAEEIGSLSIDGVLFAITTGKSNDSQLLGSNGDFSLVELG